MTETNKATQADARREAEVIKDMIIQMYAKSREHKACLMNFLCTIIGGLIAHLSPDESTLLDAIDFASKQIREDASDGFVRKKQLAKQGEPFYQKQMKQ